MMIDYIRKIKANISIYASKKTANILDGEYTSIYKGRSMEFDDLREYVLGDDIKDIDWKSTARSGSTLIRRYVAEKKHNIMLVLDTDSKMLADTQAVEPKREVVLMTAGSIAYIANQHGDDIGAIYAKDKAIAYHPFKSGLNHIENILYHYDNMVQQHKHTSLEKSLNYITRYVKRKMIIFVFTDLEGMDQIQENTLKRLAYANDLLFVNIKDSYMTGKNAYDMDENSYIPEIILKDTKLHQLEKQVKEEVYLNCIRKFKKYKISVTTIDSEKEIVTKIIDLLERHKHANNR